MLLTLKLARQATKSRSVLPLRYDYFEGFFLYANDLFYLLLLVAITSCAFIEAEQIEN